MEVACITLLLYIEQYWFRPFCSDTCTSLMSTPWTGTASCHVSWRCCSRTCLPSVGLPLALGKKEPMWTYHLIIPDKLSLFGGLPFLNHRSNKNGLNNKNSILLLGIIYDSLLLFFKVTSFHSPTRHTFPVAVLNIKLEWTHWKTGAWFFLGHFLQMKLLFQRESYMGWLYYG